ncbi:hypothetical protein NP233_g11757 [Leucocoprinus birnbaumii]|uniref:Yeast cell wall synthesis Kre9/Knh1-like N-terminal domain-containing protein n=1 Tax=Leucocoprinus birnbaumii TaxID=56174 RepID=A0AAD5YK32_9AGAR|nr:hypothetical protein NP233_g11757 [Leucocoprinus birnbaumii]
MLSLVNCLLTLLAFQCLLCVKAGLFVVDPKQGSTCHGGEPCTVTWLDDGSSPLLSDIGVATVGLYTGDQQLVQAITPVDVSQEHSLTFTPIPAAGPNSAAYYLSFISTSAKQNNSLPYAAFSPFFRLDKMTGSFATPNPTATSPIPIPSSINPNNKPTTGTNDGDVLTTITVGTISSSPATSTTPTPTPSISTTTRSSQSAVGSSSTTQIPQLSSSGFVTSSATSPSVSALSGSTMTVPPTFITSSLSSSPSSPSSPSASAGSSNGSLGAGLTRAGIISIVLTSVIGLLFLL